MKKLYSLMSLSLMALMGAVNANAFDMSFNIADGSTVKEFNGRFEITVAGASAENLASVEQYGYFSFYKVDGTESQTLLASASSLVDSSTGVISVDFPAYNLWPDYPVQTAGTYKIVVPANVITFGDEKNAETVVSFTIAPDKKFVTTEDVTFTPAPGNIDEIMPELTIQLPETVTSVHFNEVAASGSTTETILAKAQFCQIYNGRVSSSVGEFDIVANGNVLTLTPTDKLLSAAISAGSWVVRILRGSMYFNDDPEKINENIILGEWVYPEMQQLKFVPESGSTVVSMKEFSLEVSTWNTVQTTINTAVSPKLYVLDTAENQYKAVDAVITMTKETETNITLAVDDTNLQYGTYRLEIPKEQFSFDMYTQDWSTGELNYSKTLVNGRQLATYEYIAMPQIDMTPAWSIAEGATVQEFNNVTVTFADAEQIALIGKYDEPYITINQVVDGVATPWGGGNGEMSVSIEGNKMTLYMNQYSYDPNYIAVDGDYRVIIPAGKLSFNGIDALTNSEDYVLNFKVDAPDAAITTDNAVINPTPGVVQGVNNPYTITINGVEDVVSLTENAVAKLITTMGNYTYAIGQFDITVESNVVTLTPNADMAANSYWDPGNYYVQIDRGSLMVNNDPSKINDVLFYGPYTIERLIAGEIINPAPGVVESLSSFTLDLSGAYDTPISTTELPIVLSKYDDATATFIPLDNAVTTTVGIGEDYECEFTLQLATEVTEPGKYKLTIPKGAYKWEDSYFGEVYYNDLVEAEYTIKLDAATAFAIKSVNPAQGEVESLSVITIEFDSKYFANGLWNNEKTVNVINAAEEVVTSASVSTPESGANIVITLAQPVSEKGEYVVIVPEGAVEDYNDKTIANPEIRLNYVISVSGIEAVIADAEAVDVYAVSGILVKKNATKSELMNLAPGMYIINGKKVCIMNK